MASYLSRASVQFGRGAYAEALADLNEALTLLPDSPLVLQKRGEAQARLGAFHEAAADYTKVLELQPDQADVHFNRGNIYAQLNDFDKAVDRLYRGVASCNRTTRLLSSIAATSTSSAGDLDKAVADFDETLRLEPGSIWAP